MNRNERRQDEFEQNIRLLGEMASALEAFDEEDTALERFIIRCAVGADSRKARLKDTQHVIEIMLRHGLDYRNEFRSIINK